jgi:hypothetical protein
VIVDYLYIFRSGVGPPKADAISVVHADTVLSTPISPERLEPVARWSPQVAKLVSLVEEI